MVTCSVHRRKALDLLVLATTALVGAGCYRYAPVRLESVARNEDVRVYVTESAAARLVQELGAYTNQLDGQLVQPTPDSVEVAVTIARQYRGLTVENARQTLALSTSEVLTVRRRVLSRGRTAVASVAAVAGFVALTGAIIQLADPNPDSGESPPPPPPGLRFGLRFALP